MYSSPSLKSQDPISFSSHSTNKETNPNGVLVPESRSPHSTLISLRPPLTHSSPSRRSRDPRPSRTGAQHRTCCSASLAPPLLARTVPRAAAASRLTPAACALTPALHSRPCSPTGHGLTALRTGRAAQLLCLTGHSPHGSRTARPAALLHGSRSRPSRPHASRLTALTTVTTLTVSPL
ncbi:hypothetical protein Syun_013833 [Stephania yunnanensis]|uniref:Uncharacterized protein n=1 Tax=Stephania yunnanensis TaxID=152371 RepID=A0AAP0JI34_9MAGN